MFPDLGMNNEISHREKCTTFLSMREQTTGRLLQILRRYAAQTI